MTTRGGAKYSLGLDIGGTKIAAGLLDAEGNLTEVTNAPTRGLGAAAVDQIVEIVQRYADRFDLSAVGLAVPGGVDPRTGAISSAPNLDWHHLDIVAELAGRLSRPLAFRVENDACAAGWAEYRFGRHRAGDSLVLVTVGTGLGGAVVVDGHLVRGWTGAGGEVGHVALKPLGRRCECGSRSCWEQYASGTALTRAARRAGWGAATASRDVLTAAASGDERASGVVLAHAGHLVHGLAILTAVLDPAQCCSVAVWAPTSGIWRLCDAPPNRSRSPSSCSCADSPRLAWCRRRHYRGCRPGSWRMRVARVVTDG